MTSREETYSTGTKLDYGLVGGSEHSQLFSQHKLKEDPLKKPDVKSSKRVGLCGKTTKPAMEIYRPPKMSLKNGNKVVHFQTSNTIKVPPSNELKSALKRSRSFGGNDAMEVASLDFERDCFPLEYHGLIRRALNDPNSLSSRQLMELVRLICSKAVESIQNAECSAQMCFSIIEKETGHTFLESLLNSCREWFNERDKLLRSSVVLGGLNIYSVGGPKRWTAYVSFLAELYLRLKSHHHQSIHNHNQAHNIRAFCDGSNCSPTSITTTHQALALVKLLYECSYIILKPPSLNNVAEIECLRSMLTTIGHHLENDAPHRMEQVVIQLRDAFTSASIPAQIRKTVLELVELRASHWQLDLPQSMYYFPYTSVDRR